MIVIQTIVNGFFKLENTEEPCIRILNFIFCFVRTFYFALLSFASLQ